MARPSNPLADPVRVQMRNGRLGIRFYPTGMITVAADREWLPETWSPDSPAEVEAANAAADALRQRFMNHRAANGVDTSGHHCIVTTRDAVGAFIQSLVTARTPSGTVNTRRNQLGRMLVEPYGEVPVERLRDFAVGVVHRLNTEPKRNGQPKQPRTIEGSMAALAVFGAWAADWYKIVDPFDGKLVSSLSSTTAFREKSWAMVHSEDPFEDADAEESIDPDKLPTFVGISGLVDAIVRRETSRMAWHKTEGRGGKGGPRLLGLDVAVQLAESPRFIACTGVRCCEALAVHTSHLRLSTMELKVRRQLDRYQMWILGQDPPLCPPKGGHHRTVSIWPEYEEKLAGLIKYADEHTGGWLFAPSRDQKWWADAYTKMIDRARELLRIEYAELQVLREAPPRRDVFDTGVHWLRHFYASHALAPRSAGGLEWSVPFVQSQLGHASCRTTELIYQHIIQPERELARTTAHIWPGL